MAATPRYPLDKNEIGNADWKVLHTYAATWPEKPSQEDKKEFHYLVRAIIKTLP